MSDKDIQKGYDLGYADGLAHGKLEGEDKAEKRIIKLLEADEWHHIAFATRGPNEEPTRYHDGQCPGCLLIELIKEEQK